MCYGGNKINKQQQSFLSEYYSKQSTPGKFTYIKFKISSKRNKCTEAQGLQFLTKSLEICPAIFQTWKKCGKWR